MIFKSITGYFSGITAGQQALNAAIGQGFKSANIDSYVKSLNGLSLAQQRAVITSSGLTKAQQKEMLSRVKNTAATDANTGANIKNAASDIADANANDINSGSTAKNTGLVNANTGAKNANTGANIKNAGSATSNLLAATGLSGIGNALKGIGTALLTFVKIHPIITAITAALTFGGIAVGRYKKKQKEAAKEIKEAYEKAKTEIDEINSSFDNTKSKTKEISQEYAELAQEVKNLGTLTQSQGTLSTEEYEKFLDLSNQLSELFPTLNKGFDENGNAILNLSGNVDTIVNSLENLVSVQHQLANQEILEKMPKLWQGYVSDLNKYKDDIKENEDLSNGILTAKDFVKSYKSRDKLFYLNVRSNKDDKALNDYILNGLKAIGFSSNDIDKFKAVENGIEQLEDGSYKVNFLDGQMKETGSRIMPEYEVDKLLDSNYIAWDFSSLSDYKYEQLLKELDSKATGYQNKIKLLESQIASANAEMASHINTWLVEEWNFKRMDSNMKNVVSDILLNTDWVDALPDEVDENSWEEVTNWLQNNLLYSINNIDDEKIKSNLIKAYKGELTADELSELYQQILTVDGIEENNPIIDYLKTLQEQRQDYEEYYNNTINQFHNDVDKNALEDFFLKKSIDSTEELDYFNEVTDGAKDAQEAIEMYKKAGKKDKISFTESLNKDEYKEVKKELLELAKSGEITEETLESTEEYNKLLDDTETSARAAKNQILDMLTTQEKTAGVSQGLDKIKSAYEEFKDEDIGFVTAETLESLPDVLKNLPEFNLFSQIVGDPTSTVQEMQNAFNDLVTAYVNDQRLFSNIAEASESEINSLIANLKHMGITNAEEVVNNTKKNATTASYLINEVEIEYAAYLSNKDGYDEDYFNSVMQKNSTLINELGGSYKTDYNNWCELLMKKAEAYNEFVNAINSSGMFNTTSAASKYYTGDPGAAYLTAKEYLEEAKEYYKQKTQNALRPGNMNGIDTDVFGEQKYTAEGVQEAEAYIAQYEAAQAAYEKLNLNLTTIPTDFGTLLNFDGSDKDDSSEPEDIDWIETLLNNTSEALDKIKDKVDDTYSTWEERNKSLQKAITDTRNAMALQSQAEATYLAKANSIALPEYYKTLVRNGNMSIQDNVDENTSKLISEYKEWWDKAKACKEAQDELNASLKELETISKMDLVEGKYDALYYKIDNNIDTIQSLIDKAELKGMFANESYYKSMIGYTQGKINNLKKERSELSNIMNMSGVQYDTEVWNEMYQKLKDVDSEILTLENDIIGFNNDTRNLKWEMFDYLEESIKRITSESEYLIELLSHEDLFDKDTGKFTKYATATLGLHVTSLNTNKQLAKDYYEEMQNLQRQLTNGAGQEVLDRYNEVVELHQEAVLATKQEEQAILDLVQQGYEAQLDALNEIIDKKKESLNAEKDLYDYQKSIEEKTKNIASLEKQRLAYEGDDSEEGLAKAQQIKVQLEEAKADLEQTEYEKYLDDTQNMLDGLTADYEEWMNERLDNSESLLKDIINTVARSGSQISATLVEVAKANGTYISETILNSSNGKVTSTINNDLKNTSSIVGISSLGNAGGYATGTSSAKKGLHWTQEDGQEFIIRKSDGAILTPLGSGDMVFNNEASKRLWELSQDPEKYLSQLSMPQLSVGMPNYSSLATKGNISQTMEIRVDGINIELPGVTNYASFRSELIKDSTFEKAMCTMVNNIVMSKNPLEKMKYSRR